MPHPADRKLAAVRRLLPEWDQGDPPDPAALTALIGELRAVLYPQATQRAKIVAFVTGRGTARARDIAGHVGLSVSSVGGHLAALVRQGRLENPARGRYARGPKAGPCP